MKTTTILGPVALAAGVVTDGNITEVDLGRQGLDREFILTAKIAENAVAPGAARTVTPAWYWSDERIAGATAAILTARLSTRKDNTGPLSVHGQLQGALARVNTASETKYFPVSSAILRPAARYLYITITKTTEDAGSIPTLTIFLVRLPSTAQAL